MTEPTALLDPFLDVPDIDDHPPTTVADLAAAHADAGPATLAFRTSGSTGDPKGVPYGPSDVVDLAFAGARGFALAGVTADDATVNLGAPAPHISGWMLYAATRALGATPLNRNVTDWETVVGGEAAATATVVGSTPSVLRSVGRRLAAERVPPRELFPNLRLAPTGGEPTTPRMRADLKELWGFDSVQDTYGTTETGLVAAAVDESRLLVPLLDRFLLEVFPHESDPGDPDTAAVDGGALDAPAGPDPVDVREVTEPTTGSLLITDPEREVVPLYRYRIGDVVTVHPASDVPRLEVLGREDNAVNLGGALLYERDVEQALDDVYGLALRTWKAFVARDDRDDPVVRVYAVGSDLDDRPEAVRQRLFDHNAPVAEAFDLGAVGDIDVVVVPDLSAVEAAEDVSFDDTRKTERFVFRDSYRS